MCLSSWLTIVIIIFHHLGFTIAGNSASTYLDDDIAINCGSSGNSTALDGREWTGDVQSKFTLSPQPKGKSTSSRVIHHQHLSADPVPYMTARISRSQFTYTFQVSSGQKLIRLHFYPSSYDGFHVSKSKSKFKSFFSVKAGPYTLLSNFSPSLTAASLGVEFFVKEFYVCINDRQALIITFSPSPSTKSNNIYAFINGIEIVPVPTDLYYNRENDLGVPVIGEKYRFYIHNRTALEMVHRLNINKGKSIMSMGPKEQIFTWKLPVNLGFRYLVRLHFCKLESGVTQSGQKEFNIFINTQIVVIDANMIKWSSGNGFPVYRDYVVEMEGDKMEGKRDLIIALHPTPKRESETRQNDALLNGLEILKLSNPDNNLAEPNPGSMPNALTSKLGRSILAFGCEHAIAVSVIVIVTLVNIIDYQLNHWELFMSFGRSILPIGKVVLDTTIYFILTILTHESNEKSSEKELCRRFSLAEIQLATNNFDDSLVIGNGGFGKVYKGHIADGARTVAIKRLQLESKQGGVEFQKEIDALSVYRHVHLVSLIGYCDQAKEMILVYEYMAYGTLADHLYKIRNKNGHDSSPLPWEQRLRISIGVARGLDYLHTSRQGLIHRDVNSSNILLDENWVAKISDFGLSKSVDTLSMSSTHISTDIKGTFGYMDPKYVISHELTTKSDVFAFGVVLFEVLCGRPAVDTSLVEEQHSLVQWAKQCIEEGTLDQIVDTSVREQISPQCLKAFADIANKCLLKLPNERPSMAIVVRGLEFALKRQVSAYGNISYGALFSPQGAKLLRVEKDHANNCGPIWVWWLDSLWARAKPSKVKTFKLSKELCRHFSFKEIQVATDNFTRVIRDDDLGKVYFGRINDMMKTVTVQMSTSSERYGDFFAKIKMLSQLRHINLVQFIGYCNDKNMMILVYDYMANGTLYDRLCDTTPSNVLSWRQRLLICIDVARGLNYLHTGVEHITIHGFLNSHNILLDNKRVAKVWNLGFDGLGLSSIISSTHVSAQIAGIIDYFDPEYFTTSGLTEKSDVYSLGVVLFDVLCGRKVLDREVMEDRENLSIWAQGCLAAGKIDKIIDPHLIGMISPDSLYAFMEIISKCLLVRGSERPTMRHVLRGLELALKFQERADATVVE